MSPVINYSPALGRSLAEVIDDASPGTVIELPPGRYAGPFVLTRPITLKGAGDLTRLVADKPGPVLRIALAPAERVELEALALEGGFARDGGGLLLERGEVLGSNLRVNHCRAENGGGIAVLSGQAELTRLRIENVEASRAGGALYSAGDGLLTVFEGQIAGAQAPQGGALALSDGARVTLERVTITRARALTSSGGQVMSLAGNSGRSPTLVLRRVRVTDKALWPPLVQDGEWPGEVFAEGCDLPRMALKDTGLVDQGGNVWR